MGIQGTLRKGLNAFLLLTAAADILELGNKAKENHCYVSMANPNDVCSYSLYVNSNTNGKDFCFSMETMLSKSATILSYMNI
jgi:capsular polysaccharide biosynthesis protein